MNSLIEMLNLRSGPFLRFAWLMLWQSSLLIALLFVLDFALRKRVRATVRYALWMLVLLKLILPVSFSLPTSVGYWVPAPESLAMEEALTPPVVMQVQTPSPSVLRSAAHLPPPAPAVPTLMLLPTLTLPATISAFWFCVVIMLTALLLLLVKQARRLTARASSTDEFNKLLDECAQKMNVHSRVRLKLSDALDTPAVCGLFHPVILLPKSLPGKLDAAQLRAVLLHELAHVRRKDLWVSLLQTALHIFYFYNPFLWLADAIIRRTREEAVDEMVLVALADEAGVYPETLVNVARHSLQAPRLAFGFAGILESKSTLGARIRLMLHRPWPTSAKLGLPAAFALLILALVLLPMGYSGKMPSYEGKTAAEWLSRVDLRNDINDHANAAATHAFAQMGAKAVPFLRKALVQTGQAATGTNPGRQGIVPGAGRPRPADARESAFFVLEKMGPVAAPAIPELLRALAGKDASMATRAAATLGAIGPSARVAVPALFAALRAGNEFAGYALAEIDPENPELVPTLIAIVQNPPDSPDNPNSQPAVEAMAALQRLGPKAIAAVPVLRNILAQTNGAVQPADPRVFAAFALQRIAPDQPDLAAEVNAVLHPPPGPLPDINQLLADAENAASAGLGPRSFGSVLLQLGGAVGELRYRGSPVPDAMMREKILPLFDRALDESNPPEMNDIFGGLSGIGPPAAPLLPKIIAFLGTNDSNARMNALGALHNIAPGDMTTLPVLIHLLGDVVDPVKQNACSDLTHFGPEAQAAVPGLHQCLKENSFYVQFNAAVALWHIAKEPPSMALLQTAVNQDANSDYVPLHVLEMLRGLDTQTEESKSILQQLAKSWNPEVQTNALALLAKTGAN